MTNKLVSLNIEGKKHLKEVGEFLAKTDADIVCLMEVCKEDVLIIAQDKYPFVVFGQNDVLGNNKSSGDSMLPTGVAILSKQVIQESDKEYFGEKPRTLIDRSGKTSHAPILLSVKVGRITVATTHFTWTHDGSVSEAQRKHLALLLDKVKDKEMILCGDFNIPRGNELYKKLCEYFKDNIPKKIKSTLDPVLHYANKEEVGRLKYVVDYLWSTKGYSASNVQVISGVSDHCALVCEVSMLI